MIKLLYLFIHDFGNIKDQGFNLSSDYQVDLKYNSPNTNAKYTQPELTISQIKNKLPHLFHEDIIDVKGIVGENGAGKSTFLHYLSIKAHEPDIDMADKKTSRDIAIYSVGNMLMINAGAAWNFKLTRIHNKTDLKLEPGSLTENMEHICWADMPEFAATKVIFYSNVFDNKPELAFNDLLNISTNCLIRSDHETRTNTSIREADVESHRLMENKRQFEFTLQYKDRLPFTIPDDFLIQPNGHAQMILRQQLGAFEKDTEENSRLSNWIQRWFNLCEKFSWFGKSVPLRKMIHQAYFSQLILNYIVDDKDNVEAHFPGYISYTKRVFLIVLDLFEKGKGVVDLDKLINECLELEKNVVSRVTMFGSPIDLGRARISSVVKEFQEFNLRLAPYYRQRPMYFGSGLLVNFDQGSLDLYRHYVGSMYITHYLDFMLPGLSSGELGYLTLFSRFYALISATRSLGQEIETGENNLIILIDEGDLYFHPKWQTQYLKFLNEVLPRIFPEKKLQIILTSHSQFLASDLPTANLLFMRKEPVKKSVKKARGIIYPTARVVDGPQVTFAANIHDLLSDTFFLNGAHMGEFAKDVLYKVMDKLEGKGNALEWTIPQITALIDEVGEPWLKSRLLEKLSIYLNENQ